MFNFWLALLLIVLLSQLPFRYWLGLQLPKHLLFLVMLVFVGSSVWCITIWAIRVLLELIKEYIQCSYRRLQSYSSFLLLQLLYTLMVLSMFYSHMYFLYWRAFKMDCWQSWKIMCMITFNIFWVTLTLAIMSLLLPCHSSYWHLLNWISWVY